MNNCSKKLTFNIQHYNEKIIGGTYQIPLMRSLKTIRKNNWINCCKDNLQNNDKIYDYSSNCKNSRINNTIDEIFFLDNKYDMAEFFNSTNYKYSPKTYLLPDKNSVSLIPKINNFLFLKTGDFSVYGNTEPMHKIEGHSGKGVHVINGSKHNLIKNKMKDTKKYIIQEGVTNLLLNKKRKFDIRTHILFVKTSNSFQMFMWNKSYMRICADQYNPKLSNESNHLTNVHRQHFKKGYDFIKNQMFLSDIPEGNKINENIRKACKELYIIILKNIVFNDDTKPSFWVVGFDFIIDNNLKPWLLEINHNPGFMGEQNIRKYNEINLNSMRDFSRYILEKILKGKNINTNDVGGWIHIFSTIFPKNIQK